MVPAATGPYYTICWGPLGTIGHSLTGTRVAEIRSSEDGGVTGAGGDPEPVVSVGVKSFTAAWMF